VSEETSRRIQSTDDFETTMETRGKVLHRDKLVARRFALIMLLSTVVFLPASVAYALGWGADVSSLAKIITYVLTPLFLYLLLTGTVVRTVVTTEEVHVKWGLTGPRIPIETISRCEPVTAEQSREEQRQLKLKPSNDDPDKRPRRKFRLYSPGNYTEAVWLEWTDSDGTAHAAVVGSGHAASLSSAIQDARHAHGELRIEADSPPVEASEDEMAQLEEETDEASEARS